MRSARQRSKPKTVGVQHRVDLEVTPGIAMRDRTFTIPGDQPGEYFDLYRDIGVPALLLTARNPGLVDAVVASHCVRLLQAGVAIVLPDTPYAPLRAQFRAGDSLTWAYPLTALHRPVVVLEAKGQLVTNIRAEVTLAIGEEVTSNEIPIRPLRRLDRLPWS
jgi:hypothetical protein